MERPRVLGARQIQRALKTQILKGVFSTTGRLPSSRALAAELGVSRTTVTAAYEQLAAEGLIAVRQGARPVVSVQAGPASAGTTQALSTSIRLSAYGERALTIRAWRSPGRPLAVDFRYGDLAPGDFPTLAWKRAVGAVLAQRPTRLAYADPCGSPRLRAALQGYLWRARMLETTPERIIVVNGSQQGLDLCARLLLDPGDAFVIEEPCYAMARRVFANTGARPVSIPADPAGLDTDRLAGVAARLAYVTPSHQFPLGGVLSRARRLDLLRWARENDAVVIEDDYDSEYRYDIDPLPALHALEGGANVIYLGTVSKTLSPSLRIGYLVVPPGLEPAFSAAKQLADRHSPTVEQEALASLLESGAYEAHVRRARRRNGERRRVLLEALRRRLGDAVAVEGAEAGLHVVAWLRDLSRVKEGAVVEAAAALGLGVYPISPLYAAEETVSRPDRAGLVLGYAALDVRQIERGVDLLGRAIAEARQLNP
jgi:GntR family transcriptional regulator / MocR family aminotransferase